MAFCSNCGKFVENTAKFCSNCGSTISLTGITAPVAQQKTEIAPTITQKNKLEERQLFFDGEILKCPHCLKEKAKRNSERQLIKFMTTAFLSA